MMPCRGATPLLINDQVVMMAWFDGRVTCMK